jgi:Flp pilus assembly protein TadD
MAGGPNQEMIEQHYQLGMAHKNEGRYEEAVAEFKAILELDPDHPGAHLGLGLVYGFTGMFDESIEEMARAVQLRPDWAEAHMDLAKTYCMLGMFDEARTEFTQVMELTGPDHPFYAEARKQLAFFAEDGVS